MKKKVVIAIVISFFIVGCFKFYEVLNISENMKPVTLLKSIFEFEKNNDSIYQISSTPLIFIVNENDEFVSYMEKKDFKLIDQIGSIFKFEKNSEKKLFKGNQITKRYILLEEMQVDN